MQITETTKPIEREFTLKIDENELKILTLSLSNTVPRHVYELAQGRGLTIDRNDVHKLYFQLNDVLVKQK